MAFLVPVAPLLPGLAFSINGYPAVKINEGAQHLYSFNWLFGFVVSICLYTALSWAFPAKEALVPETIWTKDQESIRGVSLGSDVENQKGAGTTAVVGEIDKETGREQGHSSGS